jgi:glycosyltransferase involved in cell wall biosynthesis
LKFIDKFIYGQYDKIIAISPTSHLNLTKHLNEHNKIITINNGVDVSKVIEESKIIQNELKQKLQNKKVIIQVAGFRLSKDQDTVIKTLHELPQNYVVVFVGKGDRQDSCIALANQLGVTNRIHFLGAQNNIGSFLNLADVVVMSSNWEGFGRAAIEGMAVQKPVIATRVSGLAEVVEGAGLLFDVGDFKELSKHIIKLTTNQEFYTQIAESCFKRAHEYDIKNMVDQYEEVYKSLYT